MPAVNLGNLRLIFLCLSAVALAKVDVFVADNKFQSNAQGGKKLSNIFERFCTVFEYFCMVFERFGMVFERF
jgi:hypothetical protein